MKKFWLGLAFGAVVGGVAALLYAPQAGRSTRRKVKRSMEDVGDSLLQAAEYMKEQAEKLSKEANKLAGSGREQLDEAVDAAQFYAKSAGEYAKTASGKVAQQASRLM